MSHFYGSAKGNYSEATRCGSKESGFTTVCASWAGAIQCEAYVNSLGMDCVKVKQIPWKGAGISRLLYHGAIGKKPA